MATDQQLDIRVHGAQQTQSPVHGGIIPPHGGKGGAGIGPVHGLNGNAGLSSAYSPLTALGSRLKGWWDLSDITTLFQDSAGTTPVTVDTNPIGRITDKSGAGSHLIQATAGQRPLYRTATLPKANFDGIDDIMATAADVALTDGTGQWFAALAFKFNATLTNHILMTFDSGTTPLGSPFIFEATPLPRAVARRTDTTQVQESYNALPSTAQPVVLFINAFAPISVEMYIDGVSDGATNGNTGTLLLGSSKVAIGDFPGNGTNQAGDLYAGVVGAGAVTALERAALITYLGTKCGRTL